MNFPLFQLYLHEIHVSNSFAYNTCEMCVFELHVISLQWQDEHSHAHLAEQFKLHTIHRVYISLTCGVPNPISGRIEIPIARDSNNRIRMAAISGTSNSRHARYAASRWFIFFS